VPHIKIYIHFVFTTKNRFPFLNTPEIRQQVWKHIIENSIKKNIFIDQVGGYAEHCHCLVSLGSNQTIEEVMKLIKGESSNWINKNKLTKEKFEWQGQYFALSVSESVVERVRGYIKKQETHHAKKTFEEEYKEFIRLYKFEVREGLG
jgi:putative transposase